MESESLVFTGLEIPRDYNYQKEVCIQDENRRSSVWQQRIRIRYFLH